jgi:hypothetical protein
MPKRFKTTKFSLHLREDSSRGTLWLTDDRHKLSLGLGGQNFKNWDEIPEKISKLLELRDKKRSRGRK